MSMNPNMANREVMDLILLDYQDKTPFLNLDFANVTTTDLAATRVFAKGGRGAPNRVGFDGERTGTLKIDTQITPMKLYAMLSGSEVVKTASWMKRVVKTASNNDSTFTITLDEEPAAGSVSVFEVGDDCGAKVECTVSGSTVTLTGGAAKEYIVYYFVKKTAGVETVKFTSKSFPKAFIMHGTTPWKTEDDEIAMMHLVYYKAQPQANFSLAFSSTGDPTTLSITCDLLANEDGDIYDMQLETGEN